MSSNVGLSTPRGSGTSGYVQRNASLLKPRPQTSAPYTNKPPQSFKPSPQILQHDKLRNLEIQVLSLRDELEEKDDPALSEDEIDRQCDDLRTKLIQEMESGRNNNKGSRKENEGKKMKRYAVHDLAEAKGRESERLRRALGLKKGEGDGDDDGEHPMARQERRRRERDEGRVRMEAEREEGFGDRDRDRERERERD